MSVNLVDFRTAKCGCIEVLVCESYSYRESYSIEEAKRLAVQWEFEGRSAEYINRKLCLGATITIPDEWEVTHDIFCRKIMKGDAYASTFP